MATVTYDSELMTQQVAAIAVPSASQFVTVRDENDNPMVFSLGTDNVFYLIKADSTGSYATINFGTSLKLDSDSQVYAFDVTQNVDSTLYIVLATDSVSRGSELTNLRVMRPFKPSDYNLSDPTVDLSGLIMPRTGTGNTHITSIYMSNSQVGKEYPLVLFAYQPLDLINKTEDLARVDVSPDYSQWSLAQDLSLPENAFQMVALCPANVPIGRGFLAVYEIQDLSATGQLQLIFMATDGINGTYFTVSLTCPPGAKSLATFTNASGYTDLLVGAQGLYHFTDQECMRKNSTGTLVCNEGAFTNARQLYVTQADTELSIWAVDAAEGIGYLVTTTDFPSSNSPVQLIADGQGGGFSPFVSPKTGAQQFLVSNSQGVLSLLEQDPGSGIWKTTPFYTPALETIVEFQSYMTRVTLRNLDNSPIADSNLLLKSFGVVSIIVNGRQITTDPAGVAVRSDQGGVLTLIVPTEDISSYTFTISDLPGSTLLSGQSYLVDPANKVNDELSNIQTGQDLKNATLQSGGKLLDGTSLSDSDIDEAARAIAFAQEARKTLPPDGSALKRSIAAPQSLDTPDYVVGHNIDQLLQNRAGLVDMAWDAWNWFKNLVGDIVSWAFEKLQEGFAFLVQIGQTVYRWVLDTVVEIGKAIQWLFEKVLEIITKVIDWLGFIFNWGDIQATHNSIVHLMNSALDAGVGHIDSLQAEVDDLFDNLKSYITGDYPPEMDQVANGEAADDPTIAGEKDLTTNAKVNYSNYQFIHGGAAVASSIPGTGADNPFESLYENVIKPTFDSLQDSATKIGSDLVLLFSGGGKSISVEDALKELGKDIIIGFIDAIKAMVVGLLGVGKSIIAEFQNYLNATITIPIFSALYKTFLSGGKDLTFLDGVALILAIPVTIITKIVTGNTPPDMTGLDYSGLVDGNITDQKQLLDINNFNNGTSLMAKALGGLLAGVEIFTRSAPPSSDELLTATMSQELDRFYEPNPLVPLLAQQQQQNLRGLPIAVDWRLALGAITNGAAVPTNPDLPAFPVRIASWLVGCINTLIAAAIRKAASAADEAREKALAVGEAVLASINWILIQVVNGNEFATSSFPGKDNSFTLLNVLSSTFSLIETISGDIGILAVDPDTKLAATIGTYAGMAFSYTIQGSVYGVKVGRGDYNWILQEL